MEWESRIWMHSYLSGKDDDVVAFFQAGLSYMLG